MVSKPLARLKKLERETRLELATLTLARLPRNASKSLIYKLIRVLYHIRVCP